MPRILEFAEKHPVVCTLIGLAWVIPLSVLISASEDLLVAAGLYAGALAGSMACGLGLAALLEGRASSRIESADSDRFLSPLTRDPPARTPELDAPPEQVASRFANRLLLETLDRPPRERLH
jgi:hypothetical protein